MYIAVSNSIGSSSNSGGTPLPPSPTVYTYEINNCGGPQGTIYSSSPVFEAGITIYLNIELTEPVESNTFGDPFNKFPNEPSSGYKCKDFGFVVESNTTCP
jgi:hypothetical protein